MPPIRKVAILLLTTLVALSYGDVKHVLDGSAVANPKDINDLGISSNSFATASASFSGSSSSGHGTFQAPGKADFWWMDSNSPLKHAYEYFKKCQESGDCQPPINPIPNGCKACNLNVGAPTSIKIDTDNVPLDLKKNPFLNGQFESVEISGCTGTACKNGHSETVVTTCKGAHCESKKYNQDNVDISKNPFLNGGYNPSDSNASFGKPSGTEGGSHHHHQVNPIHTKPSDNKPEQIDLSKNPFLNGLGGGKNSAFAGNGDLVFNDGNGFLGVQPSQPFGGKEGTSTKGEDHQYKPFSTTKPGHEQCKTGHVCLPQEYCPNGKLTKQEDLINAKNSQQCNTNTDTCCEVPAQYLVNDDEHKKHEDKLFTSQHLSSSDGQITIGKSSVGSTVKFSASAGISPGVIHVVEDDVKISPFGESGSDNSISSTTTKPVRATPGGVTPDYSNEHFEDVRFSSTIQGPQYLPPVDGTTPSPSTHPPLTHTPSDIIPSCPSGQTYKNGRCQCPSGQIYESGRCHPPAPTCHNGQILIGGRCQCPNGQVFEHGRCQTPSLTCHNGQVLINGRCQCPDGLHFINGRCQTKPTTNNEYLPPCKHGQILVNGRCECPEGQALQNGVCKGKYIPPTPSCASGQILIGGACQCPNGQVFENGYCITPGPTCSNGQILIGGRCQCPNGQVFELGRCQTPGPTCSNGQILIGGRCQCPNGQVFEHGRCQTPAPTCSNGQILIGGRCQCPNGQVFEHGRCQTPAPTCSNGQILIGGRCQCPNGQVFEHGLCQTPAPTCSNGQILIGGRCQCPNGQVFEHGRCQTPAPTCHDGQVLINGRCQCPDGLHFINGRCQTKPTTNNEYLPPCKHGQISVNGRCQCPEGQVLQNGVCKGKNIPPTPPSCSDGQILIGGICQCRNGQVFEHGRCQTPAPTCQGGQVLINGRCQCLNGQVFENGHCQTPEPTCHNGQLLINGRCQCPNGQVYEHGRCQIPEPTCSNGQILIGGRCQCPNGQVYDHGRCQIPEPTCSNGQILIGGRCQCPNGQVYEHGRCQIPEPTCSNGQILIGGRCQCPNGQVFEHGRCQTPVPTCSNGEILIGGRCQCPNGQVFEHGRCQTPVPTCTNGQILIGGRCQCPNGQVFEHGRCQTPAPACRNGQVLINGRCQCPDDLQFVNGRCQSLSTNPPDEYLPPCDNGKVFINNRCECPHGQILINGRCQIPTPPPTTRHCANGQIYTNGVCQCPHGKILINGECETHTPSCVNGQVFINGRCQCPAGETFINGVCSYHTSTESTVTISNRECPLNQVYNHQLKKCVCANSYQYIGGRCVPPPSPPGVTCPPGQSLINGRCQCGNNYQYIGGRCVPPSPPAITCPPGQSLLNGRCQCGNNYQYIGGRCVPPSPPAITCPPGQSLINGRCQCGNNYEYIGGRCVPPSPPAITCPPGQSLINGRCQCGNNYEYIGGRCIPPAPPAVTCAPGQTFINGRCECANNYHFVGGRCVPKTTPRPCKSYEVLENGICKSQTDGYSYPTPTPPFTLPEPHTTPSSGITHIDCPPGQSFINGRCQCNNNYQYVGGRCVPPSPPAITCPPGQSLINGRCQCSNNYQYVGGRCVPPSPPAITCPPGQSLINGRCQCSNNYQYIGGRCVPPSPPTVTCAPGQTFINGRCQCGNNYQYIGGRCVPPAPPAITCAPGQTLINGRCECADNYHLVGGRCVPYTTPTQTDGYSYPTPTPPFTIPDRFTTPSTNVNVKNCPPGHQFINGRCQVPGTPPQFCPSGQLFIGGRCQCGNGYVFVNGKCQPSVTDGYSYPTPTPPFTIPNSKTCPFGTKNVYGKCVDIDTSTGTDNVPVTDCPNGYNYIGGKCVPKINTTPGYHYPTPTPEVVPEANNPDVSTVRPPTSNHPGHTPTYHGDGTTPSGHYAGCAAALVCVQETYCTAEGMLSSVPAALTPEQENNRVPLTDCQDQTTGVIGKCCRDPNYKDPWPSANLINGEDNGQYREDSSLGQYLIDKQRSVRSDTGDFVPEVEQPKCGIRHANTKPKGEVPLDANFAEYPWQAMILRDSTRTLLCGGVIISHNAVLTAAHCLDDLPSNDILIKGGEWRLGIDEEPLPFQIVKVTTIVRHPSYVKGNLQNDLAILMLEEKLRPAKNIGTICLSNGDDLSKENCLVTGWGKKVLQVHLKNALMHSINVNVLDNKQCQESLASKDQTFLNNFNQNTICAKSDIDQCAVDHGSALACTNGDGHYTLAGIFSFDTGCKDQDQIGGYILPDKEWIDTCLKSPLKALKRLEKKYLSNL